MLWGAEAPTTHHFTGHVGRLHGILLSLGGGCYTLRCVHDGWRWLACWYRWTDVVTYPFMYLLIRSFVVVFFALMQLFWIWQHHGLLLHADALVDHFFFLRAPIQHNRCLYLLQGTHLMHYQ